jgi:hypothetical protein
MIRSMGMGSIVGRMGRVTRDGGCWASRMGMGVTLNNNWKQMKALSRSSMVSGKKGGSSHGLTMSR